MRLHHLEIQAFGPFGSTVEIDFDELNASSQFLISGPTGSGKTFILDAICFALYGEVPGERQRAKHLRSDHSAQGVAPRVTLTLTVSDRLIRVTRSPAWERPKLRGEGTTTQQASVRLEQHIEGSWSVLATRIDDAGHLINTWLGMTPVQFTQVALLPQGGFQTFLLAPSATRQAILQRLFRTDRFERVEKWFGDLRRSLNRERSEALHGLDVIAHRLAEATSSTAPPVNDGIDSLLTWSLTRRDEADTALAEAQELVAAATEHHAQASASWSEAKALSEAIERRDAAERNLRHLEETAPDFAEMSALLDEHERASSLSPLLRARDHAAATRDEAHQNYRRALSALGLAEDVDLDVLVDEASSVVGTAERAVAIANQAVEAQQQSAAREKDWAQSAAALDAARTSLATLPQQQTALSAAIAEATAADLEIIAAETECRFAQTGVDAAAELAHLQDDLEAKRSQHLHATQTLQDLRQTYLDAREARIEAMASELAGALVAGYSCPVCGSTAHPSPASSTASVGRKREERARRAYDTANVEVGALAEVIAGLSARVASLTDITARRSLEQWTTQHDAAVARFDSLRSRAAALPDLQRKDADLQASLEHAQREVEDLMRAEAQAAAALASVRDLSSSLENDLVQILGDYADATGFQQSATERMNDLKSASVLSRAYSEAESIWHAQSNAADEQSHLLGFASATAAELSLLRPDQATEIAEEGKRRTRLTITAQSVLDDPDIAATAGRKAPDVTMLQTIADDAEAELTLARSQHDAMKRRVERANAIGDELHSAITRFHPLDERAAQVTALSALLEGTGADNRLRMRLSAFVLAERLRQVVAAANARLEVISEGRYVLNYREERGAGDLRGGLSLAVLDEWTGVQRDPTTLSGGETFIVSLCLALGLADTVADESGGLRIDTLFIDEGFGSLDAQTLDSVIDILSQLSQGGRVTGIVSHVQELRERIPATLEVVRGKNGSTVRRAMA